MIQRYSRPEMRAIWTDENKLKIWLQIELLASEALVKEGVVPEKDFAKIKAGAEQWNADPKGFVERAKEIEKLRNHDVIAFTEAVSEKVNDTASRWFHFGLTSSDIVDTAFAVQMVQSADILIADVEKLLPIIARRANEHKMTPCIGRSHGIHGEPTTFGLKMALMHDEFHRALERLKRAREVVAIGKLSGAVGAISRLLPRVSNAGPWNFATCSAPRFWKPKNPSPKVRKAAVPCRTSVTPLPGNASLALRASFVATPSPPWKTWLSG